MNGRFFCVGHCTGLKDSLQALLSQLELSWMDGDPKVTKDILDAVLIFVKSFEDGVAEGAGGGRERQQQEWRAENLERGALTKVVLALKRSDEVMNEDDECYDEDLEREPCPEEGFHSERKGLRDAIADGDPGMGEDGEEEGDSKPPPPPTTERTRLLRDVLDRSRHFISMVKRPEWQIVALDIVARSVTLLEMEQ